MQYLKVAVGLDGLLNAEDGQDVLIGDGHCTACRLGSRLCVRHNDANSMPCASTRRFCAYSPNHWQAWTSLPTAICMKRNAHTTTWVRQVREGSAIYHGPFDVCSEGLYNRRRRTNACDGVTGEDLLIMHNSAQIIVAWHACVVIVAHNTLHLCATSSSAQNRCFIACNRIFGHKCKVSCSGS